MIPSELFIGTGLGDDYDIPYSLRFRGSASAYLSKTYSTSATGAGKTFTWSSWIKRGTLGARQEIFNCGQSGVFDMGLFFTAADEIQFLVTGGTNYSTTQKFRDVAGWYHIQLSVDTTTLISTDRIKLFVNGNRITSFTVSTTPTQNFVFNNFMSGITTNIGRWYDNSFYLDGYLAEIYAIDGQALTPDNFGTFNSTTGQWSPKKYSGTYGTNGFYLDFKDAGAVANLGYDKSGNNNHWTPTNISLTAGVNYDSMLDSPTNNFPTLNPLHLLGSNQTYGSGNLFFATSLPVSSAITTICVSSGKWYAELIPIAITNQCLGFGICSGNVNVADPSTTSLGINYRANGNIFTNNSIVTTVSTYNVGDIIGISLDINNLQVNFYKNGVLVYTTSISNYGLFTFAIYDNRGDSGFQTHINFGQRPFTFEIPADYQKLCSKNLPEPSIKRGETGMDIATYTGNGGNIQVGEYQFPRPNYLINRSLRFKASTTSYLNRVIPNASGTTATFSLWIKRTTVGVNQSIFGWTNGGTSLYGIRFYNDQLEFIDYYLSTRAQKTSSRVFRDSNWHHLVCVQDTTNATAGDRFRIYVDGQRITTFAYSIDPAQNLVTTLATNINMEFGYGPAGSVSNFDGYMSEVNFIDGQALTPDNFGEQDINGYWIPKAYTGTYGTNGFYLPFSDNSALTTSSNVGIGKDFSGNSNYWTTNNISLTAGSTYDSMTDSPTQNYATFNTLDSSYGTRTIYNGGLKVDNAGNGNAYLTHSVSSGKWYLEAKLTAQSGSSAGVWLGFVSVPTHNADNAQNFNPGVGYCADGTKIINGAVTAYGATFTIGDVIGVALDLENENITFYKNGVSQGSISRSFKNIGVGSWTFYANSAAGIVSDSWELNCGQLPFVYTAPTGFNTISIPNIAEYSYDLETPDLVWIKSRNAATNHMLFDSIRGAGKYISSNSTNDEATDVNSLVSFNKNGFYLGNNTNVNTLNNTYVSWMWKAGTSIVTNTDGTITSQVRADTSKGFSVVSYSGNGTTGTVGHGLGIAPKFVLIKQRSSIAANSWYVWHKNLTAGYHLSLESVNAQSISGSVNLFGNNTIAIDPSSSVITLGNSSGVNYGTGTYIAYNFAEIEGYSKFGSYTGNGSADGPFVYCGFKPRFILIKWVSGSISAGVNAWWCMYDSQRENVNPINNPLMSHSTSIEDNGYAQEIDILSNGFKLRLAGDRSNYSGGNYIYAAFAETPFKYATAR